MKSKQLLSVASDMEAAPQVTKTKVGDHILLFKGSTSANK